MITTFHRPSVKPGSPRERLEEAIVSRGWPALRHRPQASIGGPWTSGIRSSRRNVEGAPRLRASGADRRVVFSRSLSTRWYESPGSAALNRNRDTVFVAPITRKPDRTQSFRARTPAGPTTRQAAEGRTSARRRHRQPRQIHSKAGRTRWYTRLAAAAATTHDRHPPRPYLVNIAGAWPPLANPSREWPPQAQLRQTWRRPAGLPAAGSPAGLEEPRSTPGTGVCRSDAALVAGEPVRDTYRTPIPDHSPVARPTLPANLRPKRQRHRFNPSNTHRFRRRVRCRDPKAWEEAIGGGVMLWVGAGFCNPGRGVLP